MFSGSPVYCSREDVKTALDSQATAYNDSQIDRLISSATESVEGLTSRCFYPQKDVRYWEWPNYQMGRSWRLWLDKNELLDFTAVVTGNIPVTPDQFYLEPQQYGPPYSHIEFQLTSSYAFGGGQTPQRSIAIYGTFGYTRATTAAGQLASALSTDTATSVDITNSALIGVGDMILLDTEYAQVTAKDYQTTDASLSANLAAQQNATSVAVSDGTAFATGETILVDAENMLIVGIAGNTLLLRRATNGSALASHTSSTTVYAPRTLTLIRGTLGTTASTYTIGQAVLRHAPPDMVRRLAVAETVYALQQEQGAYASIVQRARDLGANNSRIATSSMFHPIDELRDNVLTRYGRKVRLRAV